MSHDWLLLDTLGEEPFVIAVDAQPKKMIPLRKFLGRNRHLDLINTAIAETRATNTAITRHTPSGNRVIYTHPVAMDTGPVHGVHLWFGPTDTAPPVRPRAGAWVTNLDTGIGNGNADALDIVGADPFNRPEGRTTAEDYHVIQDPHSESEIFAKMVNAQDGDTFCDTFPGVNHLGEPIQTHFSCRYIVTTNNGVRERICRAILISAEQDEPANAAPRPLILAQQVLVATTEPGTFRALINLRNLTLLKWLGEPMTQMHWEYDPDNNPKIHPDDIPTAKAMVKALAEHSTEAQLRLRGRDGTWLPVHITANLVLLDQHTTAGLATIRPLT
ncbi:Uncharacterised protein [Mycobacteroides abscessus subsp. massiliense]|uniref:GAF domain-containing protein n=1 Tax=Mycobacteroides abscessus TaxID=36809 RepID=UPI0009A61E8B|nr:GAF domain-containing protein [Mycobacteroides abscessus]SKT85338.1 Uncharacterised protein [Mycobacteroides abscessus subsp. massiliense]